MRKINIKKTSAVLTLSVCCLFSTAAVQPASFVQTVQAATGNTMSNVVPVCKLTSRTATTAKLTIKKVSGASNYKVYRSTSKSGSFSYVGKTSDLSYKDTGLTSKTKYYYKVRAVNGLSKSKMSEVVTVNAAPGKVTNVKATVSKEKIKLSWAKVNGAKEYRIYRATSKDGTYSKLGSVTGTAYTDQSVKAGKTYYYKVRACKTSAGASYYGAYSKVVSGKVNKDTSTQSSYIEEVLRLVNVERKKEGLSGLTTTAALKKAAHQRAVETKTLFSHDRPDGTSCFTVLAEFGIDYRAAGENIAYGQRSPEEVVDAWMNSAGHRANILSKNFGKVGIGCYESNGILYWTQLFTN